MKARFLVVSLIVAIAMSLTHAQQVKKPNVPTLSPEMQQRIKELQEKLRMLPDLVPVDASNVKTCERIGIENWGLRPAPASTTALQVCHVQVTQYGKFCLWEPPQLIQMRPISYNDPFYFYTNQYLSDVPRPFNLKVTVDWNKVVPEGVEENNDIELHCK